MAEHIRFFLDPRCPWCYQTSRWVMQLQEAGELDISWGMFSLDIANAAEGTVVDAEKRSSPALRTMVAIREADGEAAVGRFYAALGAAVHQRQEAVDSPEVLRAALTEAGLPEALLDNALQQESTWETVQVEHLALVERTASFGVPTIVLDGGEGLAIFGPVISNVPDKSDAVDLWRHVSWLTRYENFSELKRERRIDPELPSFRR